MKLGEVVVTHVYYNLTKFHQNRMKNKNVLLIGHFSVQNFKVSIESWKSYIVDSPLLHIVYHICFLCFQIGGKSIGGQSFFNFDPDTFDMHGYNTIGTVAQNAN